MHLCALVYATFILVYIGVQKTNNPYTCTYTVYACMYGKTAICIYVYICIYVCVYVYINIYIKYTYNNIRFILRTSIQKKIYKPLNTTELYCCVCKII